MWVVTERKQGNVVRVIGPFETVQLAATWVYESYTQVIGVATTIEQLISPEVAAKPNG